MRSGWDAYNFFHVKILKLKKNAILLCSYACRQFMQFANVSAIVIRYIVHSTCTCACVFVLGCWHAQTIKFAIEKLT